MNDEGIAIHNGDPFSPTLNVGWMDGWMDGQIERWIDEMEDLSICRKRQVKVGSA